MNIEKQYLELLQDILDNGIEKKDRTDTGTISVFGRQIRHKMSEGFPLLTTKKMAFKTMVTELLWFLRGDTNIKYLVDNDCHIWDGDTYTNYLRKVIRDKDIIRYIKFYSIDTTNTPTIELYSKEEFIKKIKTDNEFAKKWGSLGKIYGYQWRNWDGGIDQISELINQLKENPDSRRMVVNAWAVHDLHNMVLPPCHYGFQVYTRELTPDERVKYFEKNPESWSDNEMSNVPTRVISLMFNMRSNDVPLGLPFNIASYGLLLEIIGNMVNMIPDELIANLGDAHIYKNQIDGVKEQLTRTPMKLPNLIISDDVNFNGTIDEFLESCNKDSFKLDGYESHPSIKMPLSN